ncbi:MAG: hypothetical protein A2045_10935 [Rhodocyclales bacterium GWA2_65_20]|nr:MAG: hypothetical protein A2045_10935 [Rhodocyclales bacterium GWA2_65_20]
MQKKIIALAVVGLMSGAAFAQSNVTIYGQMRVSVDHTNAQAVNSDFWSVSDQASRIGFKGAEDLGGGMKAIWQWESAVNTTNSTTVGTTQRNTFLGLSGNFGTALAGTHDTPYKLGGCADLFGDTAADACGNVAAASLGTQATTIIGRNGFDNRLTNVLAYISPTWSGFHFAVAGVAGEGTGASNSPNGLTDAYSMVGVYANGPLKVTLGHEVRTADFVSTTAGTEKAKGTKFNVAYKIGAIGLGYTYESSTDIAAATVGRVKDKGQLASVSYTMGKTVLGIQAGRFDNRDAAATTGDVSTWTAGAYHNLSKRTQAYAAYHHGNPQGADNNVSVITAGLNHSF